MDNNINDLPQRYLPQKQLPPYAFVPGKFPHPEKEGGHMENVEVQVTPLSFENFQTNEGYLYGLDLFNNGYYWESHVWWEALWNEAGRKGDMADFLKGLIKLGACGVKLALGQESVSQGHIDRALELLEPLKNQQKFFCGIDLAELINECRSLSEEKPFRKLKLLLKK